MATEFLVQAAYLLASGLFNLALMWMSSPKSARRGVRAGELGMVLAVAGTAWPWRRPSTGSPNSESILRNRASR